MGAGALGRWGPRSAGGSAERWRARGALAGARSAGGRAERWLARGQGAGRPAAGGAQQCAVRGRRRAQRARQARAHGRGAAAARRGARGTAGLGVAWARLVHWLGQFGAHAASLGFDLSF